MDMNFEHHKSCYSSEDFFPEINKFFDNHPSLTRSQITCALSLFLAHAYKIAPKKYDEMVNDAQEILSQYLNKVWDDLEDPRYVDCLISPVFHPEQEG